MVAAVERVAPRIAAALKEKPAARLEAKAKSLERLRLIYSRSAPLMPQLDSNEIPNRPLFRQPEVCEIARIQAYVLRSWEAEFPDLGVAKAEGGARVYRRSDVERVLRLKHLLFVEGLTLAGARRKIAEEQQPAASDEPMSLLADDARAKIQQVGRTLRELAALLSRRPGEPATAGEPEFQLRGPEVPRPRIVDGDASEDAGAVPVKVAGARAPRKKR
jgi:DNA-binding transcriptional MerR regulator